MPKQDLGTVNRQAVATPRKGETLSIRQNIDGATALWVYKLSANGVWVPGAEFGLRLTGAIVAADFNPQLDERIDNQRKSIDTLLDHLNQHCPQLLGTGK